MKIAVVIPAHNEAKNLAKTLQSLVEQSVQPEQLIVVNDSSTDKTQSIIDSFSERYPFIQSVQTNAGTEHSPGNKIINAFNHGFKLVRKDYEIICKFDADLIFPKDYLKSISTIFETNKRCGMAGGFCYIKRDNQWQLEALTNTDHIRGALKAYRKECFEKIGRLKNDMGWDTVDELLAKYHGWDVITDGSLHVKHLKPTGVNYSAEARYKQGEAFYKMRYGYLLTTIASAKLALRKRNINFFFDCVKGYRKAKTENLSFIVSEAEGAFIRKYRWTGIKKRMGLN